MISWSCFIENIEMAMDQQKGLQWNMVMDNSPLYPIYRCRSHLYIDDYRCTFRSEISQLAMFDYQNLLQ